MPIIPNGHNGTLVGHKFDPGNETSLPSYMQDAHRRDRRLPNYSNEQKKAMAEELTAHHAIAETCKECKRPLIASEVKPHYINHTSSRLRHLVRGILHLQDAEIEELIERLKNRPKKGA